MKPSFFLILSALLLISPIYGIAQHTSPNINTMTYPKTNKIDISDTYFGNTIKDPYRWLEDDRSAETKAWVEAENLVTQNYLNRIPFRPAIKSRLETLWNYEKFTAPFKEGDYTYFYKNDGLQNQYVLYRQMEKGNPEIFLNPNTFSKDATTSLAGIEFSKDGSVAAYQISEGGSDWRKVITLKTVDHEIIGDTLIDVKFSGLAWKGNEGFYYSSYEKPAEGSQLSGLTQFHKLYFHLNGSSQKEDRLIFGGEQTPRRYIAAGVTEDERFLVISAAESTTGNELYFQDLSKPGSPIVNVVNDFKGDHSIIDNQGTKLYIFTNLNAPNYKVVTVDASNPGPENWKDLIPETDNVLSISTAGGKIFANYLKDATSLVMQYDMDGNLERSVTLPGVGSASGFNAKKSEKELYYTFTSYIYPPTIFKYIIANGQSIEYKKSGVKFDPSNFISKQVFYTSKDGTKIPMIITHKKGIELNGKNPTLLYGYGGFSVSLTPAFSTSNIILLEQGGIYAVPNLRGGGEYGEKWHIAGTKLNKQNVFDDFIAAAEYLISNKYTSKEFLAVSGGSNGGLLVGAVMSQRPELFKVALPAVGVLDMLRYNKFTAGAGWAYDYGTAEDSKEMFEYLLKYSPYHALKQGVSYPATLITTADHDDRVIEEQADKWAFMLYNMGLTYK
jgi:prolyl oligopeptidase